MWTEKHFRVFSGLNFIVFCWDHCSNVTGSPLMPDISFSIQPDDHRRQDVREHRNQKTPEPMSYVYDTNHESGSPRQRPYFSEADRPTLPAKLDVVRIEPLRRRQNPFTNSRNLPSCIWFWSSPTSWFNCTWTKICSTWASKGTSSYRRLTFTTKGQTGSIPCLSDLIWIWNWFAVYSRPRS